MEQKFETWWEKASISLAIRGSIQMRMAIHDAFIAGTAVSSDAQRLIITDCPTEKHRENP